MAKVGEWPTSMRLCPRELANGIHSNFEEKKRRKCRSIQKMFGSDSNMTLTMADAAARVDSASHHLASYIDWVMSNQFMHLDPSHPTNRAVVVITRIFRSLPTDLIGACADYESNASL
jgi:hypothetical protein